MYEPEPDTIRAAVRGDLTAFEELVRANQAPVWRFLRHLVGDPTLAEDLTQETFLRVHRSLRSFRFQSKFSTWLFSIARNAAIDALRARDRRQRLVEEAPRPQATADAAARVELDACVASLDPTHREAFVLVEVFGLTYRESGQALGVPEGTVKSRVHHARRRLVAWMTTDEEAAQ